MKTEPLLVPVDLLRQLRYYLYAYRNRCWNWSLEGRKDEYAQLEQTISDLDKLLHSCNEK